MNPDENIPITYLDEPLALRIRAGEVTAVICRRVGTRGCWLVNGDIRIPISFSMAVVMPSAGDREFREVMTGCGFAGQYMAFVDFVRAAVPDKAPIGLTFKLRKDEGPSLFDEVQP